MTVGNLLALWQNNIRRMLAYSSIAHAGYMLIGLAVGMAALSGRDSIVTLDGVGTMLFYLVVYGVATVGAFAVLAYLSGGRRQIDGVDELAGLGSTHPWMAAAMAIFMFSLTGLPPLAGFWGKLALFTGAMGIDASGIELVGGIWRWFTALAIAGVINAAISAAYYLRVVSLMYFRSPLSTPTARRGSGAGAVAIACIALVVGLGFYPAPLLRQATDASRAARLTFSTRAPRIAAPKTQTAAQP
jgi:NADH-quinone oxidoreductase subunit N